MRRPEQTVEGLLGNEGDDDDRNSDGMMRVVKYVWICLFNKAQETTDLNNDTTEYLY